jgi:hypothetical protein
VEEVRRWVAFAALGALSSISFARADVCVEPRIKSAEACGVVLDPSGQPIPNVRVTFASKEKAVSATTDSKGLFHLSDFEGSAVSLKAEAPGFASASTVVESVKAAKACKRPMYVELQVGYGGCTMISLKKSDLPIAKRE